MGLFVPGEVLEDLPPIRIRNLFCKIRKELVRSPLEIHRDVQSVEFARLVLHFDLQEFLLRKDLLNDLPAQRQTRRFALEPFIVFEQRLMFLLKPSQVIRLFRRQTLEHQAAAAVLRFPGSVGVERVSTPFDCQGQFEGIAYDRGLQALLLAEIGSLALFAKTDFTDSENRVSAISLFESLLLRRAPDQAFDLA